MSEGSVALKGCPVISNMHCVKGLLNLSDSYCEKQLKKVCERMLWQSVSVENVMALVAIADKYKAEVCVYVLCLCVCICFHCVCVCIIVYSRSYNTQLYISKYT